MMDLTFCCSYVEGDKLGSNLWKQPWYDEAVLMDLFSTLWKLSILGLLDSKSLASSSTSVQLSLHFNSTLPLEPYSMTS